MQPAYLKTFRDNLLSKKLQRAREILSSCSLCPRSCGVDRLKGQQGRCHTARHARVASWGPHFGEEAPLTGRFGSGTIFFAGCNLLCAFCQNYDISHGPAGQEVDSEQLARIMLDLQQQNVHNINLVSPTHVIPQILEAMPAAIDNGLRKPLVFNSGGYDSVESLKLLEGIVDIYLPDLKFIHDIPATLYCKAPDYPRAVQNAIREMHRQVGDLALDEQGHAVRGLLVRHLVMPEDCAGTRQAMEFIAREISKNTYVNIMDQYGPCGETGQFSELSRPVTRQEYQKALEYAEGAGITRIDKRQRDLLLFWR